MISPHTTPKGFRFAQNPMSKRAPLDPLSTSDLANRPHRVSQSTSSALYHSLVIPSDSPVLLPEQSSCPWPPLHPHPSDVTKPSRATFLESTTTPHHLFQTPPTMTRGWKSENVHQPIRSRTHSVVPTVRRPPEELWRSDSLSLTPPGLPPRRHELGRSGTRSHGSASLSLALGSQPLTASECSKFVPPIGAERTRAASTTTTPSHAPPFSWCSQWKNDVYLLDTTALERVQAVAGDASVSRGDLERLLRHAVRNKYAPKVISPLSPLRAATVPFHLSTDPEYQLRMPSQVNHPSPRYTKCPLGRTRTVCDRYQTSDWEATCVHCQECKRDSVAKRLLACRFRQNKTQRTRPLRLATVSLTDGERVALANRINEVFAYVMDEEEKGLWEDVAAVTGAGPQSFSRVGVPCRQAVDDGDDTRDDYMDSDEDLLANRSATLFREVTVY